MLLNKLWFLSGIYTQQDSLINLQTPPSLANIRVTLFCNTIWHIAVNSSPITSRLLAVVFADCSKRTEFFYIAPIAYLYPVEGIGFQKTWSTCSLSWSTYFIFECSHGLGLRVLWGSQRAIILGKLPLCNTCLSSQEGAYGKPDSHK